jgi:phosphatidylglycerophosphate synthase
VTTAAIVLVTRPAVALHKVAGMTLLQRVVRTAAATSPEVIIAGDDASVMAALSERERAKVRFEARAPLAATLASCDAPVTLWLGHHVYDRTLIAALADAAPRARGAASLHARGEFDGSDRVEPMLGAAGGSLLRTNARRAAGIIAGTDPEAALREAAATATAIPGNAIPSIDASSEIGAKAATEALWQSCRKPIDGLVARHFNRYISLAISRRIVDTRITPNHVSLLCIALGVLAGVMAAQGGYAWLLAGAVLFKLNSILDGVDGELARVRWAHSAFGELLDSAGDNIANFCFFGGVSVAALRDGRYDLASAGGIGLSLWAAYLVFLYTRLSGTGRGDVMLVRSHLDTLRAPYVRAALALGRTLLRRDLFVMVSFVVAALGYAPYLLLMIFVGGSTVFTYAVLHFVARSFVTAEVSELKSR